MRTNIIKNEVHDIMLSWLKRGDIPHEGRGGESRGILIFEPRILNFKNSEVSLDNVVDRARPRKTFSAPAAFDVLNVVESYGRRQVRCCVQFPRGLSESMHYFRKHDEVGGKRGRREEPSRRGEKSAVSLL